MTDLMNGLPDKLTTNRKAPQGRTCGAFLLPGPASRVKPRSEFQVVRCTRGGYLSPPR